MVYGVTLTHNATCTDPEGCQNPVFARKLCRKHYTRWYKINRPPEVRTPRVLRTPGFKTCAKCKRDLPEEEFHVANDNTGRRRYQCRVCARVTQYGLTRDQYEAMVEAQQGRCAICGTDNPGNRDWSIDHDHECCGHARKCEVACVRKLLCNNCNSGLGMFRDSPEVLENAAAYLRSFSMA